MVGNAAGGGGNGPSRGGARDYRPVGRGRGGYQPGRPDHARGGPPPCGRTGHGSCSHELEAAPPSPRTRSARLRTRGCLEFFAQRVTSRWTRTGSGAASTGAGAGSQDHPEAQVDVRVPGDVPAAVRGAAVLGVVVPAAAPGDAVRAAIIEAGRPLPHVSVHVVETFRIPLPGTNGCSIPRIVVGVDTVTLECARIFTEAVGRRGVSTARVLPLFLCWQPILVPVGQ